MKWRKYYYRVIGYFLAAGGLGLIADEVIGGNLDFTSLGHEHSGVALFVIGLILISIMPKGKDNPLPTLTKAQVIKKLEDDILIHEHWAVRVTQEPELAKDFGDYDWHMTWIKVYRNAIFYLKQ